MILLNNLQSLQVVLASAVATAQPHFYAGYVDLAAGVLSTPPPVTGTTNSTTAVTWVAAPAASTVRQVKALSLYNADTASVTATVRVNDNGTNRTLRVVTLLPGQSLDYVDAAGWSIGGSAQSPTSAGYIDGLRLVWVSGTALTAESGSAYVQGLGRRVDAGSAIAKSSLSLSASTWYHVYLFESGGAADIEIVTTAPAAAYNGTARSKTGDPTRRYIGSVKTSATASILNFKQSGTKILYRENLSVAPFRVLSGGVSTTESAVSAAGVVPISSGSAVIRLVNIATAGNMYTGVSDDSAAGPPNSGIVGIAPGGNAFTEHPLNSSQELSYWYDAAPTGGGAYIDIYGYTLER